MNMILFLLILILYKTKRSGDGRKDGGNYRCEEVLSQYEQNVASAKAEAEKAQGALLQCEQSSASAKAEAEKAKIEAKKAQGALLQYEQNVASAKAEAKKAQGTLSQCEQSSASTKAEAEKAKIEAKKAQGALSQCEQDLIKEKMGDKVVENENREIISQKITADHVDITKCGSTGVYYNSYKHVGCHGFYTSDLLEAFYPEMYSNPKIAEHLKLGSKVFYGAVNYKFAFSESLDYSPASFSNILCGKCAVSRSETACRDNEIKSFCYPAGYYANKDYNQNFFAEKAWPNLVKMSGATTIRAKQISPLILVNSLGKMIDREGNETGESYFSLTPYLNNGHIKDCLGNTTCKKFAAIMKKVAWDSDKEVLLKTVFDDVQKVNPYYSDNEDSSVFVGTNFV
uniref:Uncharacterized protein n=1 Tax=Wolbachia endosymbiont of Aleurodicus dispersus TaxID=1288877 RepID=A0A3B0JHM8_9RICK